MFSSSKGKCERTISDCMLRCLRIQRFATEYLCRDIEFRISIKLLMLYVPPVETL